MTDVKPIVDNELRQLAGSCHRLNATADYITSLRKACRAAINKLHEVPMQEQNATIAQAQQILEDALAMRKLKK